MRLSKTENEKIAEAYEKVLNPEPKQEKEETKKEESKYEQEAKNVNRSL